MIMSRTQIGGKKFNSLVIRFRRRGHAHYPIYEIVVMKQNSRGRSSYVEKLGQYTPSFSERSLIIDSTRLAYWVNSGAVVHYTVRKYIAKFLI